MTAKALRATSYIRRRNDTLHSFPYGVKVLYGVIMFLARNAWRGAGRIRTVAASKMKKSGMFFEWVLNAKMGSTQALGYVKCGFSYRGRSVNWRGAHTCTLFPPAFFFARVTSAAHHACTRGSADMPRRIKSPGSTTNVLAVACITYLTIRGP